MNEFQKFHDFFFSPLGKDWCIYYYILLVISFIGFIMALVTSIMSLFGAKKFTALGFAKNTFLPIFSSFIMYFLSRLAYSICVGALH